MNEIYDGIRNVVTKVKPDVIVDLGENLQYTQTFEVTTRDINKKGKTHSYFQHNHIEQGTPVRPDFGLCGCSPDSSMSDRYLKTFWEDGLSNNYCKLYYNNQNRDFSTQLNQLDSEHVEIGDSEGDFVRGWNNYLSNPFDFDIISMNSQLYWSDINELLVKNKFINNQMKNGSVAIFEGGGENHPRINLKDWEQYLPDFKVELIGVTPEQRYSVCKAEYKG